MRIATVSLTVICSLVASTQALLASDSPRSPEPPAAKGLEGELRRRALFGARLAPVTKDVRERQKLDGEDGVVLEQIFPETSAADAGFQAGDVVLAIDGSKVIGIPMFLARIAKSRAGDALRFELVRDGVKVEKRATLREMPREKVAGSDVIYGSVTSRGVRLRTLVTRPKGEGRHPAVMLLHGGHTCFPIDTPVGKPVAFTWIAHDLARRGYVTMRIERPGCGDSEGGPLRDVDFDTELEGCKQALKSLKQFEFVDADNVFLFGHSMGGMMAPLMAVDVPVRGIAVFGTGAATWFEAVFEQRRRLAELDGTKPAEINGGILAQARFWFALLLERKTPRQILEEHPEIRKLEWITDDRYVGDRTYKFHHQIADKNLTEAWTKVAATRPEASKKAPSSKAPGEPVRPRVLAIWGSSDWLVDRASNAWIAEVVNRTNPGNGSFVVLDAIDHFFFRAASVEESFRLWKPVKGTPPGQFHPAFLEALSAWLNETAKKRG